MAERIVKTVEFDAKEVKTLNVAAYARVSSGKDAMLHSLAAQVSYYKQYIQNHPNWHFVEVYTDEAITGTKEDRENFVRMVEDAKAGRLDLILVKSISRFARNTLKLLTTIRELAAANVDVYFEEESIHTLSSEGEFLMSILASYAQDESRSTSENMKWRIKKNFEEGLPWRANLYGYKVIDGKTFEIVPFEAEVVRLIYRLYLEGNGINKIVKRLHELGYKTRNDIDFCKATVRGILTNEYYCGDMLLQKTYRENHITKKTLQNKGEKPMFYVENNHEGIVPKEDFLKVQEILKNKAHKAVSSSIKRYCFSGKLVCSKCRKHYKRKVRKYGDIMWNCVTYDELGKNRCPSHQIPEYALKEAVKRALSLPEFDEDIFQDKISFITINQNKTVILHFKDGTESLQSWEYKSRSESWNDEMKENARNKAIAQNKNLQRGDDGKWLKQSQ